MSEQNSSEKQLRDSDLTLKTEIPFGPIQFKAPTHDPHFSKFEPNSQIRLSKRLLSHSELQAHLAERYIVRINELYAIIRELRNGTSTKESYWNIPFIGDWVLIGVVGQRSDFKTTNPSDSTIPNSSKSDGNDKFKHVIKNKEISDDENLNAKVEPVKSDDENKQTSFWPPQKKRQYVTFKLVDLSSNIISKSGCAVVNMILFQSDETTSYKYFDDDLPSRVYRGGSGGAYEKFWKEGPGTVFAIISPKVLKSRPHQKQSNGSEILAITPQSLESILVIGKAQDLATCTSRRFDTHVQCGNWCDLRNCKTSNDGSSKPILLCDYHSQKQFFSGSSSMSIHTNKKIGHNSHKTTGLPSPTHSKRTIINGQVTYIYKGGGFINPSSSTFPGGRWVLPIDVEKRDGLCLRRKRNEEEARLSRLLNEGRKPATKHAQSSGAERDEDSRLKNNQSGSSTNLKEGCKEDIPGASFEETNDKSPIPPRPAFSIATIRAIGFDPTASKVSSARKVMEPKSAKTQQAYDDLLKIGKKSLPSCGQKPTNDSLEDDRHKSSSKRIKLDNQNLFGRHSLRLNSSLAFLNKPDDYDDDDDLIIEPPKQN
ncbi:hypothetical protein O181_004754 [Austropuccinia psidii MF-1]|uniref:Zinc finger Mcm10/DnaG-type domain-containing protein n=1 Tax=Austropuccinia psidii MF-1 TaxID=1389203 RepID=A0A9Q3GF73_9BASI|nr:hypothetical protein [Austropuccinia psidii MF-1]